MMIPLWLVVAVAVLIVGYVAQRVTGLDWSSEGWCDPTPMFTCGMWVILALLGVIAYLVVR